MKGTDCLAAASRLVVGDTLAWRDVDVRFCVVGRDAAAHPLLDLTGHRQECLLDVARVLRRGLEEGDPQAISKLLHRRCKSVLYASNPLPCGRAGPGVAEPKHVMSHG